jgi:uroporphyrinogen decarboxylase
MNTVASKVLTNKERLVRFAQREPLDRGIFWPEHPWTETADRWIHEGMEPDHDFGFDFDERCSRNSLGVNVGFSPPFEPEVLEDEGSTLLVRDQYGIVKRQRKDGYGMPQFVSFPVSDRKSWEAIKPRLDPETRGRFPADWPKRVVSLEFADLPVTTPQSHLDGFFGYLRELCGDDVYYLLHDDPDLIHDMLDFQVHRITTFVRRITQDIPIHRHYIWEDMCFKTGPLIGPKMFRRFLLEPYQRTVQVSRSCGIPLVDVDSDGNVAKLIPLWLEAGVDMLHPMEVTAGMDVVALKQQYGDRLLLRGGIDKRELARDYASIDYELARVRPAYEMGGYIPTVDHSVPPDVPWDNYQYYTEKRAELVGV